MENCQLLCHYIPHFTPVNSYVGCACKNGREWIALVIISDSPSPEPTWDRLLAHAHASCKIKMIRFLLLQNRAGKTRLSKYYVSVEDVEKQKLEYEIHRLVATRDPRHTNFAEVIDALHCSCMSHVGNALNQII
jgi:organic hydroperoxide reductase OsmC/OhrA